MGETSSPKDAFARRTAPASDRLGAGADHFKRSGGNGGGDRFARNAPAADKPTYDAFARKRAEASAPAPAPAAAPKAAKPKPPPRATAFAAPKAEPAPKPAGLRVVPAQAASPSQGKVDDLMFGTAELAAADARRRRSAKTSSLVLVTGGGLAGAGLATASAAETMEAPPSVAEKPAPPPKADPAPLQRTETPKRSRGGGGGGGNGAGSGGAAVSARRGFDQDDIAGVIFGLAVIVFLVLWMLRGRGEEQQVAEVDPLLSTQFAANDTGPPPTFTPQVDPFGDRPFDLKPTGPIPEAAPAPPEAETTGDAESALVEVPPPVVAAAPPPPVAKPPVAAAKPATPAASAAITKLSSQAWFCTGSSTLTVSARNDLARSIEEFRPYAKEPLVVHAFADTRGASDYNLALSGSRARVVADFLRTNGLEVVESVGKGELSGLADNQNCANQRRADIFFKAGSELRPSAACLPPEEVLPPVCS